MKVLIALLLLAAAALSSALLFFVAALLILLMAGIALWMHTAGAALRVARHCETRAFFGDPVAVRIHVLNGSGLPIPWLRLTEHRPGALILPSVYSEVLSLAPGERAELCYTMAATRRGLHAIGPLLLTLGDPFGLSPRELLLPGRRYLLVYPRLLPLRELALPTRALLGDLPARRRLLGDPARVAGVRDYLQGDPLHDIHWRATASVGRLQVKQYQPSTTVQTLIVLDQQPASYAPRETLTACDLAVSVAATIADHLIRQRQEVGLATNGRLALLPPDAEAPDEMLRLQAELLRAPAAQDAAADAPAALPVTPAPIVPAAGHAQLMRLFEVLARLEPNDRGEAAASLLRGVSAPFGSTVVVIMGAHTETGEVLSALRRLKERGLLVELLLIERGGDQLTARAQAQALSIPLRVLWPSGDVEAISA
jgi:uncharacterized protein (DUF58 family)